MKVRNVTIIDLPQIVAIDWDSFDEPWSYGTFLAELDNTDSYFELVDIGFVVVGYSLLRHIGDDAEILRIAVDRSQRKNGIADALMTSQINYAKSKSVKSIFLEVRKSNFAAIALYKKHGFEVFNIRKNYYTMPSEDALIMLRKL